MKPTLSQLLASVQLAEMAHTADPVEHKKAAWEKAQSDYDQALEAEHPAHPKTTTDAEFLTTVLEANEDLFKQNEALKTENSLLNNQLIEKELKINELEKSAPAGAPVSAKPATLETAPAGTQSEPTPALTPYQKGLQTRQANLTKAAADVDADKADDSKKND